ncbi:uncharacterized protein A4U43_C01F3590 [Asparagus officinalis]|uniref:Uncharacterized protein n=1 Tax=Asparagus officinalis TaxID=4686 RepID=A0A5P1FLH2_ASPOF|nr:uncharacterized protein A4U43_C01F3590 [Asparagus officinalis]
MRMKERRSRGWVIINLRLLQRISLWMECFSAGLAVTAPSFALGSPWRPPSMVGRKRRLSSYGRFYPSSALSGFSGAGGLGSHGINSPLQSSIGSGSTGQVPSSHSGGAGLGSFGSGGGFGGPYGSSSQFSGGSGSGGYGGFGMGSSLYNNRLPASSGGMGSGAFSEGGPYSSLGHSGQHLQSAGSPPGPRIPSGGGMYQGLPPYY